MRHTRWIIGLALLGWMALAIQPAAAQYFGRNKVQYDDFDFKVLETENFEIYYYPEEERAVRDAARMAERWYDRHQQTFVHAFDEKKPIIFYANDADFQQTNVTESTISQGTGGFTESIRERVVMPLTGSYGATDHVLGHELVHSFQYDIALNGESNINLRRVPLWLVEGMAEYLSIGRYDPHTAMWMRDAALRDDLPTIADLNNPRDYFPYRYGQAYMAYVGGKYGDQAVPNLYRLAGRVGIDSAATFLFGISPDSLSTEWATAIKDAYLPLAEGRTPVDSAGRTVLSENKDGGRINVAPALSPDGRYVAFLSERNLFDISLFVADAETGEVIESLGSVSTTLDLDAIRFISSAGAWDPMGERLAFISYADGDNKLSIWNVETGEIEQSFAVQGVTAMKNPAWSPDGSRIAFSGLDGGISDLYVLDVETNAVRQLTNDRYADLQPTWSPSGDRLAFTTDRASTEFQLLRTSQTMQLALVDVESGDVEVVAPFEGTHHHNPQFSPDGRSLYFIGTPDGFKDIYRYTLSDGSVHRVTRLQTGVSGITALSPAMSVARQSGDIMFSIYSDGKYTGVALPAGQGQGTPVTAEGLMAGRTAAAPPSPPTTGEDVTSTPDTTQQSTAQSTTRAGTLPPYSVSAEGGLVNQYLSDAQTGLPPASEDFSERDYDSGLQLEGILPPSGGVSVGGPLGTGVVGGVGLRFGDMLGNQQLGVSLQANGSIRDIGGGVSYINRGNQFNWGGSASHVPIITGQQFLRTGVTRFNQITQRIFITQLSLNGAYPQSTTRRFEVGLGGVRYGFGTNVRGPDDDEVEDILGDDPSNEVFGRASLAYVIDFSDFGFTSPVRGGRMRFQVAPLAGTQTFLNVQADVRRYFYAQPFTFAVQAFHAGNYGAGSDDIFGREYLGYSQSNGFIRGYGFRSFDSASDCVSDDCAADFDRLFGTRVLKVSTEVRLPIFGVKPLSLLDFQYLPLELAPFVDAGVAWTDDDGFDLEFSRSSTERVPIVSTGVAARVNLFGTIVLEPYWAYAFQRNNPSVFGLRFQPGW